VDAQAVALVAMGLGQCALCKHWYAGCLRHQKACKVKPTDDDRGLGRTVGDARPQVRGYSIVDWADFDVLAFDSTQIEWVRGLIVEGPSAFFFPHQSVRPSRAAQDAFALTERVYVALVKCGLAREALALHLLSFSMVFAPVQGEDGGSTAPSSACSSRVARFLSGDWKALYLESRDQSVRRPDERTPSQRMADALKGIQKLITKDAAMGKASQRLLSLSGPSPDEIDETELLRQFGKQFQQEHTVPVPELPDVDDEFWTGSEFEWVIEDVEVEVLGDDFTEAEPAMMVPSVTLVHGRLPRAKAQDFFGARYEHYGCLSVDFVSALSVDFMNARFPEDMWPILGTARAYAVVKDGGKFRFVSNVWILRKIAERAGIYQQKLPLTAHFRSVGQQGFGVSGGVEYVHRANLLLVEQAMEQCEVSEEDCAASCQVDVVNAYPSLFRARVLEASMEQEAVRPFARSARMCLSVDSVVMMVTHHSGVAAELQQHGVSQGSPAAGVLFAAGTHPLWRVVQGDLEGSGAKALLIWDDIAIAGKASGCLKGFKSVTAHCRDFGLEVHPDKLKGWVPGVSAEQVERAGVQASEARELWAAGAALADVSVSLGSALSALVFEGFALSPDGLPRVLGAPLALPSVAGKAVSDSFLRKAVRGAIELADAGRVLNHSQCEFLLLRFCVVSKLAHLNRYLSWELLEPHFKQADGAFRNAFCHAIQQPSIPDYAWERVKLPTRFSGLAVGDLLMTHPAASLCAAHLVAKSLQHDVDSGCALSPGMMDRLLLTPDLLRSSALISVASASEVVAAAQAVNPPVTPFDSPVLDQLGTSSFPVSRTLMQRVQRPLYLDLLQQAGVRSRKQESWMRSCAVFPSGSWVHSVPTHRAFEATSAEFQVMLTQRLDLDFPLVAAAADAPCCMMLLKSGTCGHPHDASIACGSHWHCQCPGASNWPMHNAMRGIVGKCFQEAGDVVKFEMRGLYADSEARPADIFVGPDRVTARGTKDRAIDFVCADPRGVDAIFLHNADKRALAAAGEQELSKVRQHEQRMADQGLGLLNFEVVPFAFESSGAWGITGQLVWKELKVKLKAQKELLMDYQTGQHARTWSAFTPYQWFPQCASFAVAKHSARLVLAGIKSSAVLGRVQV